MDEIISLKLKGLRAENSMSLEKVAELLGVNRETIRKYEKSAKNMTVDMLIKLLNLYNVKINIFFEQVYGKMSYK